MDKANPKALLIILDGFGVAKDPDVSAIAKAQTPFIDTLFNKYPHSTLSASGENVGLPTGQFGNSEVGHMNIGAGRIVRQELSRINQDIKTGRFFENKVLLNAINKAKSKKRLHLMGLFSEGGVHSHNNHLLALLKLAAQHEVENVFVHAFSDGRDSEPNGGIESAKKFQEKARAIGVGQLASIIGRYYAMDRDQRWNRTQKAYELLVNGTGKKFNSPIEALETSYAEGITDEFVKASAIGPDIADSRIKDGDVIIFYNIRGDRARQITRAFTEINFDAFPVPNRPEIHYFTFTQYDDNFKNVEIAYPPPDIKNTLGETANRHGLSQLRIAETEKYAHVTYFLNGGREKPFKGEERIIIPSPKVATYDLQPEMSAPEVAQKLCEKLTEERFELGVINFANPDMVGHTGDMEAAIKAVETIDEQLKKVAETAQKHGYKMLIIADHGNADCMIQEDGSPHTAHTTALVPAILIGETSVSKLKDGILADVAPTLLKMLHIEQPEEMSGKTLF
ncbi:MAG TPA: 2,3-bisphosphoglycerate-independent phosphoglycerate mutase [Balneolaceae bacterium]|nr:2,3-bisphosphoglycerate-independent phosphoglycerate mutase [Balneolaceae bacterium]